MAELTMHMLSSKHCLLCGLSHSSGTYGFEAPKVKNNVLSSNWTCDFKYQSAVSAQTKLNQYM